MTEITIEQQLYVSLKAMPCRCVLERTRDGTQPLWTKDPVSGTLHRRVVKQCSRCAAIERCEAAR
jgi:hypothetical protein